MKRIALLIVLAGALGGCQHSGSVANGESKVFERPTWVVLGRTVYDQAWIDSQIEGGVAAFGWPRPAPRPPELDEPTPPKTSVAAKPKKKMLQKLRDHVHVPWPNTRPDPIAPVPPAPEAAVPAPEPVVVEAPPPPPPPRVRRPIEILLHPNG